LNHPSTEHHCVCTTLKHTQRLHRYAAGACCRQCKCNYVCIPHKRDFSRPLAPTDIHILYATMISPGPLQNLKSSSSRCYTLLDCSWYYFIMGLQLLNVTNTVLIHIGQTQNYPYNIYFDDKNGIE